MARWSFQSMKIKCLHISSHWQSQLVRILLTLNGPQDPVEEMKLFIEILMLFDAKFDQLLPT